ncbi:RHS repeat-associated core domain-containing protein [Kribbella monticola]|uniref:RHS repeat-associated core domain-containing protein n=1 Tax=Kribbella monticola TaxID=2185285 RepID=UPI000DD48418|nr:RHS repeat-associated core domain-containing protein [Kribbella monticola]
MPRSTRRKSTAAVACLLSLTLLITTRGLEAEAATTAKPPKPSATAPKAKSVPVTTIKPKPGVPDLDGRRTVTRAPAVVWPKPGVAEVAVPRPVQPATDWSAVLTGQHTKAAGPAAKANGLPVKVGPTDTANRSAAKAAAATPTKVKVSLLGRSGDQLRLQLNRSDGVQQAGAVQLRVDYSAFAHAYGGDWNSRLRVVRLPDCALTTPGKAACAAVPVATRNDGSGELSADVPATAKPTTFALQAAASGPAGDSTATSLNETATWQAGGSSGDFTWNYPMKAPPSLGGPSADVALTYSSGSLDGRTTSANSQSSWAGAGFELAPGGSIERKYASCSSKSEQSGNNGTKPTGDLCWATDNATFTLNGSGGELVKDDATGVWHPRVDDGTKVEHLYGAINGDLGPDGTGDGGKGEYWVLTDKAGTRFYFGKNKLPGSTSDTQDTHSVWTVPVFGNNGKDATHPADEPCHTATFASSACDQAYRWNLDYVVDTHGSTMSLFYDVETNKYARNVTATSVSTYTRAGNIRRIEYGQTEDRLFKDKPVAAVDFVTADRCYAGSTCAASDYPDTPLDLECTSTSNCNNHFFPSFWTKKRLAKVTTSVLRAGTFQPVSSWTFRHNFLNPNDTRSPLLWLDGITNTGLVGGTAAMPETSFAGTMKPNRVVGTDGLPAMNWPRITSITYGTGGQLTVGYLDPDCSLPGNVPTPDSNDKRCHPIKWTPQDQAEREDWFGKYVVTSVTESDLVSGVPPVMTTIQYEGPPAWRHDEEDGLVEVGKKTWSQWRGYEKVKVTKGDGTSAPIVKENVYFRGMDGDVKADGSTKSVQVTDSTGGKVTDQNALSGMIREQSTLDGTTVVDRAITDPWLSPARATRVRSWGTTKSYETQEKAVRQDQVTATGRRQLSSSNDYDADGRLVATSNFNDQGTAADDTCTRYKYAENPSKGLAEVQIGKQVVDVACDQPWTKDQVVTDERTTYDGNAKPEDAPVKGDKTKIERLSGFAADGTPTYQTVAAMGYDALGRLTSQKDAADKVSTVTYTPATASGGPLTQRKSVDQNGLAKVEELDPAFGSTTALVDPSGDRTDIKLDPLGRKSKTWLPGRDRSAPASQVYTYQLDPLKPGLTTTTTVQADGSTAVTYDLTDGLLRKRQTQQTSGDGSGRVITDYLYDSRGLQVKENGPYYSDAPVSPEVATPADESKLPTQKVTQYDDQGRPAAEITMSFGKELWRTTHVNTADRETIIPPQGEQASTKITDAQGRLLELWQFTGSQVTTSCDPASCDKTVYTYHPAGQLATVKDASGNLWKYDYDLRGRKVRDQDPDKGVTTYTYDDLDQVASSTDSRGITTLFQYDNGGRKIATYRDSISTANMLSSWLYDTVRAGSLTSATHYVNGNAYTLKNTAFDDAGRPTATEVVIPAAEGALAGTYPVGTTYTTDGQVASSTVPAVGGLPAETVNVGYNDQNLPISVNGADNYVTYTSYTPYREPSIISLAKGDNWLQQTFDYDEGTRRLLNSAVETPNEQVSNVSYGYDPGGNITKLTEAGAASDTRADDTQCFSYDSYRRLTQAWTPGDGNCAATPSKAALGGPAPYWQNWTFDKSGNRKTQTSTTPAGTTTSTYFYPAAGAAQPHALQKVTSTGLGGDRTDQFSYDASGNLKTRSLAGVTDTLTWDAENHLSDLSGGGKSSSYIYDADGNRLLKKDTTGTTLYLGGTELLMKPDKSLLGTRYYNLGDKTVAVRVGTKLTWLKTDLHGTATVSVDPDTLAVQRRNTTPYGEIRGAAPASWPGQRGFVGGTEDSTGLVHLGAREYDQARGRFISVDPVMDFKDPQQLNAYSYANNNPISFSDADGKFPTLVTVMRLITVTRMVTERIVEYRREIIHLVVNIVVNVVAAAIAMMFGNYGLAARMVMQVHRDIVQIKRIVVTINKLIRDYVLVATKILVDDGRTGGGGGSGGGGGGGAAAGGGGWTPPPPAPGDTAYPNKEEVLLEMGILGAGANALIAIGCPWCVIVTGPGAAYGISKLDDHLTKEWQQTQTDDHYRGPRRELNSMQGNSLEDQYLSFRMGTDFQKQQRLKNQPPPPPPPPAPVPDPNLRCHIWAMGSGGC